MSTFSVADINLFLLVFMRMSGAILFNPIFGRRNVPVILRAGLALIMAFLVTGALGAPSVAITSYVQLFGCCLVELSVGFLLGVLLDALFSVVLIAGELIDMQMGLSMSVIYDPSSRIQMPVVGSFFNAVLVICFFSSGAHLAFLRLLGDSFRAVPPGMLTLTAKSMQYVVLTMGDVFELGLRLALPFLAVQLLIQIALGILMRSVPQINIFSVGLQIQTLVGIGLLLMMFPVILTLCSRLSDLMLEKCAQAIRLLM